jgi:transposase
MCTTAGVKVVYLPPYSPDLNPIEEIFSEFKAFIRRNWVRLEEDPQQGFQTFLEWCIEVVGSRKQSALGHFQHAGVVINIHD